MKNPTVVVSAFVVAASGCISVACITTVNHVDFKPAIGAPTLPERAEGCAVEIFDENQTPPRPHQVLGRLELSWSAQQVKEQGPDYAMKTLKTAVCERGGHYLLGMRALPRGYNEGMLFEGEIAVITDDDGNPLQGVATGTASSSDGVTTPTAPPTETPSPPPSATP
jgi:hypothetical protein